MFNQTGLLVCLRSHRSPYVVMYSNDISVESEIRPFANITVKSRIKRII